MCISSSISLPITLDLKKFTSLATNYDEYRQKGPQIDMEMEIDNLFNPQGSSAECVKEGKLILDKKTSEFGNKHKEYKMEMDQAIGDYDTDDVQSESDNQN